MNDTYTKTALIKELALAANISKQRVEVVLETLTQVAYREAHNGFTVPGICRLDVVHRKARQVRNPQTNQILQITAHDALRVRPLKRAKDAIAPIPRARVQIVSEPDATPTAAPATPPTETPAAPAVETTRGAATPTPTAPATGTPVAPAVNKLAIPAPAAPAAAPKPYTVVAPPATAAKPFAPPPVAARAANEEDEQCISFRCKKCAQEIEAPLEMVGASNECPTCGENLIVPYTSEPGTIWYQARATTPEKLPPTPSSIAAMKGRTIRIELPDDL